MAGQTNYHNQQVVNLLQVGFPLGIEDRSQLNRACIKNHSSANAFREAVTDFIDTELNFVAFRRI